MFFFGRRNRRNDNNSNNGANVEAAKPESLFKSLRDLFMAIMILAGISVVLFMFGEYNPKVIKSIWPEVIKAEAVGKAESLEKSGKLPVYANPDNVIQLSSAVDARIGDKVLKVKEYWLDGERFEKIYILSQGIVYEVKYSSEVLDALWGE